MARAPRKPARSRTEANGSTHGWISATLAWMTMHHDGSRCTTGTMVLLEWPPAVSAPAPRWSIDALSASPSRPQGPIVPRISGLMPLSARSSQLSVPRCRGPLPSHPFPSLPVASRREPVWQLSFRLVSPVAGGCSHSRWSCPGADVALLTLRSATRRIVRVRVKAARLVA